MSAVHHNGIQEQEIKKSFPVFLRPFFQNAGEKESFGRHGRFRAFEQGLGFAIHKVLAE